MSAEDAATSRTRLADGFTPENPPPTIAIRYDVSGTGVEGVAVIAIDGELDTDDLWKTEPGWNHALGRAPFLEPLEFDDEEEGFISNEMAEQFYDIVQAACTEAGVAFEWDWLDSGHVFTLAYGRADGSIQLDHAYDEDGVIRVESLRIATDWQWGGEFDA